MEAARANKLTAADIMHRFGMCLGAEALPFAPLMRRMGLDQLNSV